jgi:hypothetical protein
MTLNVVFEQVAQGSAKGVPWIEVLSALLTPTIAVFAAIVAWQQWCTNRSRLKHELFDRRYKQFLVVRDFLTSVVQAGRIKPEEEQKFLGGTRGMRFIFDQRIATFVDETLQHLTAELHMLNALLDDPSKDNERARNTERRSDVRKQLNEELQNLEERFAKYLQLGH